LKTEPAIVILLIGFLGAGVSCLVLFYLNSFAGLTSNDLAVQVFGWGMLVFLLIMACVPLFRFELKSLDAKRILKPLEADR
jgi:hypothetical protein